MTDKRAGGDRLLDRILEEQVPTLDPNGAAFCRRVYGEPRETYAARLRAVGFEGLARVLDAGCGFGQWSLAMAAMNDRVDAVDVDERRLRVLEAMAAGEGLGGIGTAAASVGDLPFADDSFDGLFCYGVIFTTPWKETLGEFRRVLKPGGLLYLTANEEGYYLHIWKNRPHPAANYDPRETAALSFVNTWRYEKDGSPPGKGHIIITADEAVAELKKNGFTSIVHGGEGTVTTGGRPPGRPFFPASYEGLPGVYEIVARRGNGERSG